MNYCINVRFKKGGKTYYFSTDDITIKDGDFVVVETIVGLELGTVIGKAAPLKEMNFEMEIKPIIRRATLEDLKQHNNLIVEAKLASNIFEKLTKNLNLNMNLISAMYTLDKTKILFTYVSEERVDFRELLKELANELHCRIELKQVNPRERAQLVGGLGNCGRELCCTSFLTKFESISLNKAKNQMLSINIPKLSGLCGKLMCCLKYEDDAYTLAKKDFPPIGTRLIIDNKEYKLTSYNVLTKVLKLEATDDLLFLPLEEAKKYITKQNKNESKK